MTTSTVMSQNIVDVDDRLSSLPEAIVAEDLSLVPIETAVSTSVLSKRWRNLWKRLPSLKINNKGYRDDHDFFAVANKVICELSSRKNLNAVELEAVELLNIPTSCGYLLDAWITLLSGLPLKQLSISLEKISDKTPSIPLLPCIFLCRTLVLLKLDAGFEYRLMSDHDGGISLPNLKNFDICVRLRDDKQLEIMTKLLKSCPLLEQLRIIEDAYATKKHVSERERCVAIVSKNLKLLELAIYTPSVINKVTIDTPKLEYVKIYDTSSAAYDFVGMIPTAFSSAWLIYLPNEISSESGNHGILHSFLSERIGRRGKIPELFFTLHALPVLEILRNITAALIFPSCFGELMRFLKCCRNVEAIVLNYRAGSNCTKGMDAIRPADCLLTKVKMIKIQSLKLDENDDAPLVLVKYILSKAKVLESLVVDVVDVGRQKALQMWNEEEFVKCCTSFREVV